MGMFDGVENATMEGNPKFPAGEHKGAVIALCQSRPSQDPSSNTGTLLIVEFDCSGRRYGWVSTNMQPPMPGAPDQRGPKLARFRQLVACALGKPIEQVTQADCENAIGPQSAIIGKAVDVTAEQATTKAGHVYSKLTFSESVGASAAAPPPPPGVAPEAFPPAGWAAHPSAPGYYYKGQEVVSEADLRARGA